MRRKLTTIVAADIVGYSQLLSQDEVRTLASIEMLRGTILAPLIAAHSGRIFRFLGDGTLLEFESVLGAVEFAVEVQRNLAARNAADPGQTPILLRIGINLGDVVMESGELHGDGVNIAVRLEGLAEPGGICITDSVYAQIKSKLDAPFIPMGFRSLKNIVDPIQVWRWRPLHDALTAGAGQVESPGLRSQQAVDPLILDMLLKLHARSAALAVSDALDLALDETTQGMPVDKLYFRLSEQLQQARALLQGVSIERVDNFRELSSNGDKHQTLGDFVSSMFNDSKAGYAFNILPEVQKILASQHTIFMKRKLFMAALRRFHNDEFIERSRSLIKLAYLE